MRLKLFHLTVVIGSIMLPITFVLGQGTRFQSYCDLQEVADNQYGDHKLTLVFNSSPQCGACLVLKKDILSIDSVSNFLKSNFNLYELDYSQKDQNEYALSLNMQGGPFFAFLDDNGILVHRIGPDVSKPNVFISQLKATLKKESWLSSYDAIYKKGGYHNSFLKEYAYEKLKVGDIDSVVVNKYINGLTIREMSTFENMKFIMDMYMTYQMSLSFPYDSKAATFLRNNQNLFEQYFLSEQIKIRKLASLVDWLDDKTNILGPKNSYLEKINELSTYETVPGYLYQDPSGRNIGFMRVEGLSKSILEAFYIARGETD